MKKGIKRLYALHDRGQLLAHVDASRWDELGPFGPVSLIVDGHPLGLRYTGQLRSNGPSPEPVIVLEPIPESGVTLPTIIAMLGEPNEDGFHTPAEASIDVPNAPVGRSAG